MEKPSPKGLLTGSWGSELTMGGFMTYRKKLKLTLSWQVGTSPYGCEVFPRGTQMAWSFEVYINM